MYILAKKSRKKRYFLSALPENAEITELFAEGLREYCKVGSDRISMRRVGQRSKY
jgi:hypothetical protein